MVNFVEIIYKVLKNLDTKITRKAMIYLEEKIRDFYNRITFKVYKKYVDKTIRTVLPSGISNEILEKTYRNFSEINLINDYHKIKNDLDCNKKFAIVILSAIEYMIERLSKNHRHRLQVRDIVRTIREDEELNLFFQI